MAATTSRPPQLSIRQLGPGTISTSQTQTQPPTLPSPIRAPVLRLRGAAPREGSGRRISWAEDVIDNEGLGRKKSKGISTPSNGQMFIAVGDVD
jgi:protein phosphatase 1 regulatory subunit 11